MRDARFVNTSAPPAAVSAYLPPERPLRPTLPHPDDLLVAVHDIAVQVSSLPPTSDVGPQNGRLEAVAAQMARTATDRLGDRELTFIPSTHLTDTAHASDASPDLSAPVQAGDESPPVGHLHLWRGDGVTTGPADVATVALLARLAVAEHLRRQPATPPAPTADDIAALRRELAETREEVIHLREALASNRDIGVAIGIIVATERTTPEAGFDRLRVASQNSNRKLRDIAADVVYTGVVPPPTPPGRAGPPATSTSFTVDNREGAQDGRTPPRRHSIDVTVRRDRIEVDLAGEFDTGARADLDALLRRVEPLPVPVHLRADLVTFADSHGIGPLQDAMLRQAGDDEPPLVLDSVSGPLQRALTLGDSVSGHHVSLGHQWPPATGADLEVARVRWAVADAAFDTALDQHASMAELRELDEELDAAVKAYTAAERHRDSGR